MIQCWMVLVRPRLTDYHNIGAAQEHVDFAIPFFNEDVPLYVDPFLLWRSPSQQDQALHTSLINSFNHLGWLQKKGRTTEAVQKLIIASECDEVGLGESATRKGKRIGTKAANGILQLFKTIPEYQSSGFTHFEAIQLYIDGISKDRISDFACNFLKSFLVDYTIENCLKLGIPLTKTTISTLHDYKSQTFKTDVSIELPINPDTGQAILLVPKRWLRFSPWISFDDFFASACPKDEVVNAQGSDERVNVLMYNRDNYAVVSSYLKQKELVADDCKNDPLFKLIPVTSARRKLAEIKKLPTGLLDNADKKYENALAPLLASVLYPHLDFADTQSRTDSGSVIRDLVFYNNRSNPLLADIHKEFGSRQIVMEMKNVKAIERDHINQLNRYLANEFGAFGVLLTRNPLSRAMYKNTVDLWAGQRRCIIALTDADIELMVELFDSKQREPIDVLRRSYLGFRRACPS